MVTAVLARPVAELTGEHDDDRVHIYCCDKDLSLCGKDVTDEPEMPDTPDEECCAVCVGKQGLPCASPDCGYRSQS
jgi:hypothetical protein